MIGENLSLCIDFRMSVNIVSCEVPFIAHGRVPGRERPQRIEHNDTITVTCTHDEVPISRQPPPKYVLNDERLKNPKCYNGTWSFLPKCVPGIELSLFIVILVGHVCIIL